MRDLHHRVHRIGCGKVTSEFIVAHRPEHEIDAVHGVEQDRQVRGGDAGAVPRDDGQ